MPTFLDELRKKYPNASDQELESIARETLEALEAQEPNHPAIPTIRKQIQEFHAGRQIPLAPSPSLPKGPIDPEMIPAPWKNILGALLGGASGAIAGGLPGAAIGGALGAAFPPETPGDVALTLGGGALGRAASPLIRAVPSTLGKIAASSGLGAGTSVIDVKLADLIDRAFGSAAPPRPVDVAAGFGAFLGPIGFHHGSFVRGRPSVATREIQEQIPALAGKPTKTPAILSTIPEVPSVEESAAIQGYRHSQQELEAISRRKQELQARLTELRIRQKELEASKAASDLARRKSMLSEINKIENQLADLETRRIALAGPGGPKQMERVLAHQEKVNSKIREIEERINRMPDIWSQDEELAKLKQDYAKQSIILRGTRNQLKQGNITPEFYLAVEDSVFREMYRINNAIRERLIRRIQETSELALAKEAIRKESSEFELRALAGEADFRKAEQQILEEKSRLAGEKRTLKIASQAPLSEQEEIAKTKAASAIVEREIAEKDALADRIAARIEDFRKTNPVVASLLDEAVTSNDILDKFFDASMTPTAIQEIRTFFMRESPDTWKAFRDAVLTELFKRSYDPKTKTLANLPRLVNPSGKDRPPLSFDKLVAIFGNDEEGRRFTEAITKFAEATQKGMLSAGLGHAIAHAIYYTPFMLLFHPERVSPLITAGAVAGAGALTAVTLNRMISWAARNPAAWRHLLRWFSGGAEATALAESPVLARAVSRLIRDEGVQLSEKETLEAAGLSVPEKPTGSLEPPRKENLPQRLLNPGAMKDIRGDFMKFRSSEEGWKALLARLDRFASGDNQVGLGPRSTLEELISKWAPPHENDTSSYVQFVSSRTGLPPTATLGEIRASGKIPDLALAIAEQEGFFAEPKQ